MATTDRTDRAPGGDRGLTIAIGVLADACRLDPCELVDSIERAGGDAGMVDRLRSLCGATLPATERANGRTPGRAVVG